MINNSTTGDGLKNWDRLQLELMIVELWEVASLETKLEVSLVWWDRHLEDLRKLKVW